VIDHRSARSARLLEKMLEYSPYHLGGVGGFDRIKYQLEERMYRHIALSIRIKLPPYYTGLMKKTEKFLTENDLRKIADHKKNPDLEKWDSSEEHPKNTKPFIAYWAQ